MTLDAPAIRGEKISVGVVPIERGDRWLELVAAARDALKRAARDRILAFCGAAVLWAAPALLLTRFGPASALNWLANVPLKGSLLDELCLAAGED